MTSPYLTRPVRTLEQALAEQLRRPVPVGNLRRSAAEKAKPATNTAPPQITIIKSAEGGD